MIWIYVILGIFLLPRVLGGTGLFGSANSLNRPFGSQAVNPPNAISGFSSAVSSIASAFSTPPTSSPSGLQVLDPNQAAILQDAGSIDTIDSSAIDTVQAPLSTTLIAPPGATDPLANSQGTTFEDLSSTIGF